MTAPHAPLLGSAMESPGALSPTIDALFADCASSDGPGVALLVAQGGRVLHKACHGMAEIDRAAPITPQTRLHLGSASKHICAAGVAVLEHRGELELDDAVGRFLPDLPPALAAIALRQLLTMTSGLFDGLNMPLFAGLQSAALSQQRHYDILRRVDRLMFGPGDAHTYSNSNYLLISRVIERVSGASLGDFMRDAIFAPLGMNDTVLAPDPTSIVGRARGYAIGPEGRARPAPDMTDLSADGGIVTTLEDMERWLDYFSHGRIGDMLVRDWLAQEAILNDGGRTGYGLGLAVGRALGRAKLSHAGGMHGFVADFAYFPDDDLGIVMMSNKLQADLIERTDRIAALALGAPAPIGAPAAAADALGGVYVCRTLGCTAEFAREGDETVLHLMGERFQLAVTEAGVYRVRKPGVMLELRANPAPVGERPVLAFSWGGGRAHTFRPWVDAPILSEEFDSYVGAYRSPLLGETHFVKRSGEHLHIGLESELRALLWGVMKPRGDDLFSCIIPGEPSDTDVTIQFQRDDAGSVVALDYNLSRTRGLRFVKLS